MKANNTVSRFGHSEQPAFASALDAFGSVPHSHSAVARVEKSKSDRRKQPSFAAAFDNF